MDDKGKLVAEIIRLADVIDNWEDKSPRPRNINRDHRFRIKDEDGNFIGTAEKMPEEGSLQGVPIHQLYGDKDDITWYLLDKKAWGLG